MNYICAICQKNYDTVEQRAACESKCLAEEKKKADLLELKKKAEARKTSEKAAIDALDAAEAAVKDYFEQYDRFSLNKHFPYLNSLFNMGRWWF